VGVFCKTKDIFSQSRKERKEKRQKIGVVVKGKEKTKGRKPQRAHPPNSRLCHNPEKGHFVILDEVKNLMKSICYV
jgi:hypothetical protein